MDGERERERGKRRTFHLEIVGNESAKKKKVSYFFAPSLQNICRTSGKFCLWREKTIMEIYAPNFCPSDERERERQTENKTACLKKTKSELSKTSPYLFFVVESLTLFSLYILTRHVQSFSLHQKVSPHLTLTIQTLPPLALPPPQFAFYAFFVCYPPPQLFLCNPSPLPLFPLPSGLLLLCATKLWLTLQWSTFSFRVWCCVIVHTRSGERYFLSFCSSLMWSSRFFKNHFFHWAECSGHLSYCTNFKSEKMIKA